MIVDLIYFQSSSFHAHQLQHKTHRQTHNICDITKEQSNYHKAYTLNRSHRHILALFGVYSIYNIHQQMVYPVGITQSP